MSPVPSLGFPWEQGLVCDPRNRSEEVGKGEKLILAVIEVVTQGTRTSERVQLPPRLSGC